jgi:hypothetical protein
MRITLEQRGGFAGVAIKREVDTQALSVEEAAEVERLVHGADVFTVAEPPPGPRRGYDMQSYRMTVEEGERKRVLHLADGAIPPTLGPLVAWMQKVPPGA